MEKTAGKDEGLSLHTNLEILVYLCAGVFTAILPLRFQYIALFPLLTYGYMHNRKALLFFLFSLTLFLLALSVSTAYLTLLGILIFFLLVQCASAAHGSMPFWLTIINLAIQLPYVIQVQDMETIALLMGLLTALYFHQLKSEDWMHNDLPKNDLWKGSLLCASCLLLILFLPKETSLIALVTGMLIMFVCQPLYGCMFLLLLNLYIPSYPLFACLSVVFLRLPISKGIAILLYLLGFGMLHPTLQQGFAALAFLLLQLMIWQRQQQIKPVEILRKDEESHQLIKRRLQNYSGVFYSLAQFYEHLHQQESALLYQMADGVEQMALQVGLDAIWIDENRLKEVLEGYQFVIYSLKLHQQVNVIRIEGVVDQISHRDVEETLLPLLNTLYLTEFHIEYLKDSRLFYHSTSFVFESSQPLQVDACYDSISVQEKENGDTCSIFRHGLYTICSISDGMGYGPEASQSSILITGIFQRMIASDMEIVQAIQTINRLIHSDVYATLDVICINAHTRKAYLVKSAACPTLLIRNERLLQIDGHSLPIGIVEEMEPDCMELQLEKDDEILMISDGVHLQEIHYWLHTRKKGNVHEEHAQLMKILRQRTREDDTTALLLRLQ